MTGISPPPARRRRSRAMLVLKVVLGLAGLGVALWLGWFGVQVWKLAREDRAFKVLIDTHDLDARIAARAASYVGRRPRGRLTVGVWQDGRRWIGHFGREAPPQADTPAGRVLYEIGSITKVFTGLLLAEAEARGEVALDDPIGRLLPADAAVPEAVRAITLKQLATHTSGLPRLPDNLDATSEDPYARYGEADLLTYLRGATPDRPPGESASYSNLGAGLLGYLLARTAGTSYEDLVRDRIAGPLGLADTTTAPAEEQRVRLIGGTTRDGRPVPHWTMDVLAPAGALRSTAEDMLKFIEMNLDPDGAPIGRAIRRAREVHFGEGGPSGHGLGWILQDDVISKDGVAWHNGGTGGFSSFLGLVPARRLGIVLLSNTGDAFAGAFGDGSLDDLGFSLLRTATKVSLPAAPATSHVGQTFPPDS